MLIDTDLLQVETSIRSKIGGSEQAHILSLVFAGCRSESVTRWHDHSPANVQERLEMDKAKDQMATPRRITMVSSTSGLLLTFLDNSSCLLALC